LGSGFRIEDSVCSLQSPGLRVEGFSLASMGRRTVPDFGFEVQDFGFRLPRLRVQGFILPCPRVELRDSASRRRRTTGETDWSGAGCGV
jgi:hypothetical protein